MVLVGKNKPSELRQNGHALGGSKALNDNRHSLDCDEIPPEACFFRKDIALGYAVAVLIAVVAQGPVKSLTKRCHKFVLEDTSMGGRCRLTDDNSIFLKEFAYRFFSLKNSAVAQTSGAPQRYVVLNRRSFNWQSTQESYTARQQSRYKALLR